MSAAKLTKKQKKGLAFRERSLKGGNRTPGLGRGVMLEEEEMAVPQRDSPSVDGLGEEERVGAGAGSGERERAVSVVGSGVGERVGKTGKRKRDSGVAGDGDGGGGVSGGDSTKEKERMRRAGKDEDAEGGSSGRKIKRRKVGGSGETGEGEENANPGADADAGKADTKTRTRFILFVGNLKYTTSLDAIKEHFDACDPPPHIRLLTPKPKSPAPAPPPTKSKGCAFLEFSHRNALQQGLKLHGSTLDGRRINVELTAGGGGKSEQRVQKVQARNKHLLEERKARVQKAAETGADADTILIAPPQRHSTTSGIDEAPQKRRTWTVPEAGEASGRGGVKKRGKKGKSLPRHLGTGANAVAVG